VVEKKRERLRFFKISFIWALVYLSSFAVHVFAEEDPYLIESPEDLVRVANRVNEDREDYRKKSYKLTRDIDMSGYSWTSSIGFIQNNSEGKYNRMFEGDFDGGGHVIANLSEKPLFDVIGASGRVGNLKLIDVNIKGISGLVEENRGLIENCYVDGEIQATTLEYDFVGGFAGYNTGKICDSIASCDITLLSSGELDYEKPVIFRMRIGGFLGENGRSGLVENCSSYGSIKWPLDLPKEPAVGMFVGRSISKIINCSSSTSVTPKRMLQALEGSSEYSVFSIFKVILLVVIIIYASKKIISLMKCFEK
jgi:hypothetical protein